MVSYGLRRGCRDLYLFYPNTTETCRVDVDRFKIESGFSKNLPLSININALELPFWSFEDFGSLQEVLKQKFNNLLTYLSLTLWKKKKL
jgi:hypothetical protein